MKAFVGGESVAIIDERATARAAQEAVYEIPDFADRLPIESGTNGYCSLVVWEVDSAMLLILMDHGDRGASFVLRDRASWPGLKDCLRHWDWAGDGYESLAEWMSSWGYEA